MNYIKPMVAGESLISPSWRVAGVVIGISSKGRTSDFDSLNGGSNPSVPTKFLDK